MPTACDLPEDWVLGPSGLLGLRVGDLGFGSLGLRIPRSIPIRITLRVEGVGFEGVGFGGLGFEGVGFEGVGFGGLAFGGLGFGGLGFRV